MSVIVKGMEMPKSCITCPLCECRNECAYCEVGDKYLSWDWDERLRSSRNDHCPLQEVPPHGRLIEEPKQLSYDGLVYISPYDAIGTAKYFLDQIRAMPTIIPASKEGM